ncbi:MAG TPA: ergothioneine biosynthesis protein EgtB [Caulobacteraceae bacterium]|jgi:ergothioneine biosynthesis protein EgtB
MASRWRGAAVCEIPRLDQGTAVGLSAAAAPGLEPEVLAERFAAVRARSLELAVPLSAEDQQVQSMPDVSPTKWHLAHTTWFFETFVAAPHLAAYEPFDPAFSYLFNSYYEAVGPRHARPERGLLTRPPLERVLAYRRHVDAAVERLLDNADGALLGRLEPLIELGLHHEQQHQELILMDIKHVLSCNPLKPAYLKAPAPAPAEPAPLGWAEFPAGLRRIGHDGDGFAFDNEGPRHRVFLEAFALADRPATCADYLAFIEDGGYVRPELWLSDGWAAVQAEGWREPLYWREAEDGWRLFTLHGERPLHPAEPVCHLSFYEADAFARWSGARLPTEAEWETAAAGASLNGNLGSLHPAPAPPGEGLRQMIGDVWEWTASPYVAYPRFKPAAGALGEYNGKFMSGQMVLRGGGCVTPAGHVRVTYRNFFPPHARWMFGGLRLAHDL